MRVQLMTPQQQNKNLAAIVTYLLLSYRISAGEILNFFKINCVRIFACNETKARCYV